MHPFIHAHRNPLDILMSTRSKGQQIGAPIAEQNPEIFRQNLVSFLYRKSEFSRSDLAGHVVDYDLLIEDPVPCIVEISRALDCELQESDAYVIWKQLAFKQLPGAPDQHFRGGGSNKGVELLTDAERKIVKSFDLESWLEPGATNTQRNDQAAAAFTEYYPDCNGIFDAFNLEATPLGSNRINIRSGRGGNDNDILPFTREEAAYAWANIGPCVGTTVAGLPLATRDENAAQCVEDAFKSMSEL